MAFDHVRLPEQVEVGSTGGPRFQTSVLALGNGSEQRNVDWIQQRCAYDISYGIQSQEDTNEVVRFFYARRGKARGFRFKDWSDYEAIDQSIGEGDGTQLEFQLVKHYDEFVRVITKPVEDSVTIKVAGVVENAWTCDIATGIVTFADPPADGAVIQASFEFDVPVRFDSDELVLAMRYRASAVESIRLVEVFEE